MRKPPRTKHTGVHVVTIQNTSLKLNLGVDDATLIEHLDDDEELARVAREASQRAAKLAFDSVVDRVVFLRRLARASVAAVAGR